MVDNAENKINNIKSISQSLLFLQIGIAIAVLPPLVYRCIGYFIHFLPQSELLFKKIEVPSMCIVQVISLAPLCFVLIGLCRIIYLLKSKINLFYSITAIALFTFYFLGKVIHLWQIIIAKKYSEFFFS